MNFITDPKAAKYVYGLQSNIKKIKYNIEFPKS